MDKQFTANDVRRLSNRIPRNNDEIADAQEALRAYADLLDAYFTRLEADESAKAVAFRYLSKALTSDEWVWSGWLDLSHPGLQLLHSQCKAMGASQVEYAYTTTHPAPASSDRLADEQNGKWPTDANVEAAVSAFSRNDYLPDFDAMKLALLAAHPAQAQPQNGDWVLVPRDPTHAMRESAASYGGRGGYNKQRGDDAMEVWRDMLAAVPQPPAARVPGVSAQAHENAQAALAAQENPNGL